MAGLPITNWIRFFVWMSIGLVFYYNYGRKRSTLARRKSGLEDCTMLRHFRLSKTRRSNTVAARLDEKASRIGTSARGAASTTTAAPATHSQFTLATILGVRLHRRRSRSRCSRRRDTIAWGASAQRMIVGKAVDTLPPDLRPFFDDNRPYLALHVADPLDAEAKDAHRTPQPLHLSRSIWPIPVHHASSRLQSRRQQVQQIETRTDRFAAVADRRLQRKADHIVSARPLG